MNWSMISPGMDTGSADSVLNSKKLPKKTCRWQSVCNLVTIKTKMKIEKNQNITAMILAKSKFQNETY